MLPQMDEFAVELVRKNIFDDLKIRIKAIYSLMGWYNRTIDLKLVFGWFESITGFHKLFA